MKKGKNYIKYIHSRIKSHPRLFRLYTVLRILVILTLIRQIAMQNYEGIALCILSLFLFLMPGIMADNFKVEIPPIFEAMIYCFIYAAEILGEINHFYIAIPGWDSILHTINGFLCAAIGFSMIDLLNRHSKHSQLSPFYLAMVAFCFSMTIGVCWEFIECTGDLFFGQDMQKDYIIQHFQSVTLDPTHSQTPIPVQNITKTVIYTASGKKYVINGGYLDIGLLDTMKDLLVNLIGALTFSVFGYFYIKDRGKRQRRTDKIVDGLIVRVAKGQQEKLNINESKTTPAE